MQEGYPSGKRPRSFGTRTPITTNGPPAAAGPRRCRPARVGARRGARSAPKWLDGSALDVVALDVVALSRSRPALPSSRPASRCGAAARRGTIASVGRPDRLGSRPRRNRGNVDPRKRNITLNIWMRRERPPLTKSDAGTPCRIGAFVVDSSGDASIRPLWGEIGADHLPGYALHRRGDAHPSAPATMSAGVGDNQKRTTQINHEKSAPCSLPRGSILARKSYLRTLADPARIPPEPALTNDNRRSKLVVQTPTKLVGGRPWSPGVSLHRPIPIFRSPFASSEMSNFDAFFNKLARLTPQTNSTW